MRRTSVERGCFAFVCVCSGFFFIIIMKATHCVLLLDFVCLCVSVPLPISGWHKHSMFSLLKRGFTCDVSSMSRREALSGDL